MELKELIPILEKVLNKLFERDKILMKNDVHEQSLSHKVACYLEEELRDFLEKEWYSVDVEYNRYWEEPKRSKKLDNDLIKPDIIIHRRGINDKESNFVIFEVKKWKLDENDERKLIEMTEQEGEFKYKYWVWLYNFDVINNKVNITIYRNGDIEKELMFSNWKISDA